MLVILDNIASLFRDMELFDEALDVTAQADVISTRLLARVEDKKGKDLMWHCDMLCYVMLCYVMLCYVMLCDVMLC